MRCCCIIGWEAQEAGLLLIYLNGQREVIEMPAKEAEANSTFLCGELMKGRDDIIGISWED